MLGMVDLSNKKGSAIHGIIEEYMAKGNISVGGFVKYLNGLEKGEDTQLSTDIRTGVYTSGIALSKNKVFVVYSNSSSGYWHLWGMVCTINSDNTITTGESKLLTTGFYASSENISLTLLAENKVLVAYPDTNKKLCGELCTIDENIIETKSFYIDTDNYSNYDKSTLIALNENKVFVAYSNSNYSYSKILTIDGDTVTIGEEVRLTSDRSGMGGISAILLSENKIFIVLSYGSYYQLYAIICTVENDTITIETTTSLSTINNSGKGISMIKLSNNKVLVIHPYNDTNFYLYGIICIISNNTITVESDTQLSNERYSSSKTSAIALNESTIIITYGGGGVENNTQVQRLYVMVCIITGSTITVKIDAQLSSVNNSALGASVIRLSKDTIFLIHSYNGNQNSSYLYEILLNYFIDIVQIATQSDKIFGIAQNKALDGQTVKVVRPNYLEEEN